MSNKFVFVDADPNPVSNRTRYLKATTADDALAEVKRDWPAPKQGSAVMDPQDHIRWLYAIFGRETEPRWG